MKQTTLDLNGPILEFSTNPQNITVNNAGIATFIGIASAYFISQNPTNTFSSNTGIVTHRWYAAGIGALSDGINATLKATLSGTATTTLTVSNVTSPTTSGIQLFVSADYIPSAYQSSSPITAGTGRSTGNAINEILFSNTVRLLVRPQISIATQPIGSFVTENTNAFISVVAASTDTSQGTFLYQWSLNGIDLTNDSTVSGSTTPNLTISRPIGIYTLQVKISNLLASNTPIFSESVNIEFISRKKLISTELYDTTSSTAVLSSQDLLEEELTLVGQNQTSRTSLISLYAPETNINVEMDIYSGSGIGGAQGGYSRIRFLMRKNEEYTIAGLDSFNNCPFIYRKATLIAVCGKGGDSSTNGNGGSGGGINVAGASGSGRGGGAGGASIATGTLPSNGISGSSSTFTPISPDTKATGQTGGRVLPCPKGNYWISQGKSPCSDVGTSKIFLGNGTLVTNSASIARGFKSGYDIRQTGGQGQNGVNPPPIFIKQTCERVVIVTFLRRQDKTCYRDVLIKGEPYDCSYNVIINKARLQKYDCSYLSYPPPPAAGGNGGAGATGGSGGTDSSGGGGGSGYTDGSVTVVSTQQGGSTGFSKIIIRAV